jgi:hypothetical protein
MHLKVHKKLTNFPKELLWISSQSRQIGLNPLLLLSIYVLKEKVVFHNFFVAATWVLNSFSNPKEIKIDNKKVDRKNTVEAS